MLAAAENAVRDLAVVITCQRDDALVADRPDIAAELRDRWRGVVALADELRTFARAAELVTDLERLSEQVTQLLQRAAHLRDPAPQAAQLPAADSTAGG